MRTILMTLLLVAGFLQPAMAEPADIGPAIGTKVPQPFTLVDRTGAKKVFADVTGDAGVVFVFVRSAAWCPYCIQQLRDIQSVADPVRQRGFRLASISYDAPDVLAKFAEKYAITYDMLSDKDSVVIDAFGIRDPQYTESSKAYGVPKPGIFVFGRDGVLRAKLAEEGYKVRPPSQAIVAAIEALKSK